MNNPSELEVLLNQPGGVCGVRGVLVPIPTERRPPWPGKASEAKVSKPATPRYL